MKTPNLKTTKNKGSTKTVTENLNMLKITTREYSSILSNHPQLIIDIVLINIYLLSFVFRTNTVVLLAVSSIC